MSLDGFEFLTMAEAGEVGHWEVLEQIANTAKATNVLELTAGRSRSSVDTSPSRSPQAPGWLPTKTRTRRAESLFGGGDAGIE